MAFLLAKSEKKESRNDGDDYGGEHVGNPDLFAPNQVNSYAENQNGADHGQVG